MFRTITRRRRAEDTRVAAFLFAIELSARHHVDPDWQLLRVPDDAPQQVAGWRTDTVAFPRIVLAGTAL
jgi:hypothetical protein